MKKFSYLIAGVLTLALGGCVSTPASGTWDITTVSADGPGHQTLVVKPDLTGTLITDDNKTLMINNGKYADGIFTFDVTFTIERTQMSAKYEVSVQDDVIDGVCLTADGSSKVTGQRRGR